MAHDTKEKRAAYAREWAKRNPEKRRAYMQRWRERHPEAYAANNARWKETPEQRHANRLSLALRDPVGEILRNARASARKRGLELSICRDDIAVPTHCPVLGIPLARSMGDGKRKDGSPSIDRIDNSIGYVPGNVIVVSWRANSLKSDATHAELRALADFYGAWRAG